MCGIRISLPLPNDRVTSVMDANNSESFKVNRKILLIYLFGN